MKKKTFNLMITTILFCTILIGFPNTSLAQREGSYSEIIKYRQDTMEGKIDTLQSLEILQGNGESLELDKPLNRLEGSTIYFRLMGLDEASEIFKKENPNYNTNFIDIPPWARDHINYLHYEGIVHGIGQNFFGSKKTMTAEEFTTLVLRGLGYDHMEEGFKWNDSLEKALEIGLISNSEKSYIEDGGIFTKEKMALIAYNTLFLENSINNTITLFHRQNSAGYISRLFYTKLNSEEIKEINKSFKNEAYDIFPDSPEKKQELYNKIHPMISQVNNIFNVVHKDSKVNVEVVKIRDILISAKNHEIFIRFDLKDLDRDEVIPSSAKAIVVNGFLTIQCDEDFGKASSIIWSALERQWPNTISDLVYLRSKPMNPWNPESDLNYESFILDEANILDKNQEKIGTITIYNSRKDLDIYFDIYLNE